MPVKLDLGFMTFDLREIPAYARRAEELERNKHAVKQQFAFYASTRTFQAVLAVHGLDFAVTATWGTLGARLRERYDGICDRTQLYPAFQPSLDDPRLQALVKEMNQAAA